MGGVVSSIFGGGREEGQQAAAPAPPPPDYESLWGNYSGWVTDAEKRYKANVSKLQATSGMSEQNRAAGMTKLQEEYQAELSGFKDTETYRTLEGGVEGGGSVEDFYRGKYGGAEPAGQAAESAGGGREAPRGPVAAAPVAGLGDQRPWWAL